MTKPFPAILAGWLARQEQDRLRHKRVASPERAGVYLLTLCRLGIGKFHLADFDAIDMSSHKCPYTNMACHLCIDITAIKSKKVRLDRDTVLATLKGYIFALTTAN